MKPSQVMVAAAVLLASLAWVWVSGMNSGAARHTPWRKRCGRSMHP
jgi:hypothetical protein